MGVIYKLKEDVISFIIDQKKNNPSVGVRQIAALTSEKFHTRVSKSSVNSVLKSASLSSSVGRRAADMAKAEKFTIPPARKKEISKNMHEAGYDKEEVSFKEEKKGKIKNKEEKIRPQLKAPVQRDKVKEGKVQKDRDLPLMPDPLSKAPSMPPAPQLKEVESEPVEGKEEAHEVRARQEQDFLRHVEQLRNQKRDKMILVPSGMGFVFLKAAQWEVSNRSLMGGLFKKHVKGQVTESFNAVSDIFLFFKFFGAETFEDISAYQKHGLWILENLNSAVFDENKNLIGLQKLFQWDKTMRDASSSSIVLEYGIEKEQAFTEVKGFKLLLEDTTELIIDASLSSFGVGAAMPAPAHGSSPVNKAMTRLSNCLVSNIQSAVFQKVPGETKFDQAFYDMVAVFENFPGKKILKATVLNENEEEIAEFSTVPYQKRTFLVGVSPRQNEFAQLTKTVKWAAKKPFYHEETDQTVYFTETKTDFIKGQIDGTAGDLRVITVWQNKEKGPSWVILTNQGAGSSEEILGMYMSRWPYFDSSAFHRVRPSEWGKDETRSPSINSGLGPGRKSNGLRANPEFFDAASKSGLDQDGEPVEPQAPPVMAGGVEWGDKQEQGATALSKDMSAAVKNNQKVNDFSGMFTDFVQALHGYCQRHFFQKTYAKTDITNFIQSIYGSSGFFYGTKDHIVVSLEVSDASSYRKDLEYAVKRVNERQIFDYYGRRLWLEI